MNVRIAGAGSRVADHVITNERITRAIPGWTPERIVEKTGVLERRFAWDFDERTGKAKVPPRSREPGEPGPSVQLSEAALLEALRSAGLCAADLDGLILTTCTPDIPSFSHDAMIIHRRLGMRPDAFALLHDDGCGGALFHLAMARELLMGGARKTIAIVGANAFSAHLDREAYSGTLNQGDKALGSFLSWYLFGDGAGAIILQRGPEDSRSGIVSSYSANEHLELVVRRGGGNLHPLYPGRGDVTDNAFYVDGQLVAQAFAPILKRAIDGALARADLKLSDIRRFYLHQANKRVLEAFIRRHEIPPERVPMHMERYGNLVSAGTLVLLAEDLASGAARLGSGELVLMAALGAGAQSAAHVIRL